MKKPLVIFLALIGAVVLLAVLGRNPDFSPEQLGKAVAQAAKISRYCGSINPDFDLVKKTYEEGPRDVVRWVDGNLDIEMDDKINDSRVHGKKGNIPRINAQIIDLTVTRVFFEYFRGHVPDGAEEQDLERARALSGAFRPVVKKAEARTGQEGRIEQRIKKLLFESGPAKDAIPVYRSVFLLNLLSELDRLELARESKGREALFFTARALQFFHILYQDVSRLSREDAVYIYGEFRKKPVEIDLVGMRLRLKGLFAGKLPFLTESHFEN